MLYIFYDLEKILLIKTLFIYMIIYEVFLLNDDPNTLLSSFCRNQKLRMF